MKDVRWETARSEKKSLDDYINGLVWDGMDRLPQLCNQVKLFIESDRSEFNKFFPIWLATAIRQFLGTSEVVNIGLLLIGEQGCGKGSLINSLVPKGYSRYINPNFRLYNHKNSLTKDLFVVISEIVINERYVLKLKQIMDTDCFVVRSPYSVEDKLEPKRSSFIITSNDPATIKTFNNTKVMPVSIQRFELDKSLDMGQVYAQLLKLKIDYDKVDFSL